MVSDSGKWKTLLDGLGFVALFCLLLMMFVLGGIWRGCVYISSKEYL